MRILALLAAGSLAISGPVWAQANLADQAKAQVAAGPAWDVDPNVQWAPLTKFDPAKLPPDIAPVYANYARVLELYRTAAPGSVPQVTISDEDKIKSSKKRCQPTKHLMSAKWEAGGKINAYWGEAINCVPTGIGIITFASNGVWVGEVSDLWMAYNPADAGKKRDHAFAIPLGVGIVRSTQQLKSGGGIVLRSRLRTTADPAACNPCIIYKAGGGRFTQPQYEPLKEKALAIFPAAYPSAFVTGTDDTGNGTGVLEFVQGTRFEGALAGFIPSGTGKLTNAQGERFEGTFEKGQPKRGSKGTMHRVNGSRASGTISSRPVKAGEDPMMFAGYVRETLATEDPELKIPAGEYWTFHYFEGGKVKRWMVRPLGATLQAGGPQRPGCLAPTFVPTGWTTFWPVCDAGGKIGQNGKASSPVTVSFSPDTRERLDEIFEPTQYRFHWTQMNSANDIVREIRANQFVAEPAFGPVGQATMFDRSGMFRGEFVGMVPDGPGICDTPSDEGGGEEPCFYVNGARTDEIQKAREEARAIAKASKREADRLAAEQAALRAQQEAAARQQREAEEAQRYAEAEARRAQRRAEIDAENDEIDAQNAARGNPILNALNEVGQKFQAAAVENQRGWDRVNQINAQQQRAADARAAQRQSEQARVAQANAAAAEARAAQARNAQAITAAEIQRRQADAQARVAEARQRAIAQQQAQAQQVQAQQAQSAAVQQGQPVQMAQATQTTSGPSRGNRSAPEVPISWLEGVVVCPMKEGFMGSTVCDGPFQNAFVDVTKPEEVRRACGSDIAVRAMGTYGGNRVFGCNFGINPTKSNSPHVDQAARHGLVIPNRRTFRCPAVQSTICKLS